MWEPLKMPSVAFLATEMKKYDFSFPSLRPSVDATLRAAIAVHKFVRNEFGQRSWPHWGKLHGCSLHKFVRNEFGQRSWPHRGKLHGCSLHKFVRNEFGQRSWPHWGKLHGCSLHKFVRNEFGQRSWPHRGKLHGCSLQIVYPDDLSFSSTDVLKNGSISIMLHGHL